MSFGKFLGVAATIVGGVIGGPAGAAAGAAIGGAISGAEAESSERKAAKQQRRLAQLQAARQRKELIREVQFAQAAALSANIGAGVGLGSSTIQGQQSSQRATLKDDLGFQGIGGDISSNIWRYTKEADKSRTWAAGFGAVSQIAGMAGMFSGPSASPGTSAPNAIDTRNFGTQAAPIGTTTPVPIYNTIDPFGGP
jgi:hypothetical protein